jgi:hypothetical protein
MERRRRIWTTAALAIIIPGYLIVSALEQGLPIHVADAVTYIVAGWVPVAIWWGLSSGRRG